MSEMRKWAREMLDHSWDDDHDPIPRLARAIIMDTDRLNAADTSPASQERDDLERIAEMADVLPAHCGDPEVLKVLHDIRDKLRALARPSGGEGVKWEEHGAANLNPERWEGYKGVGGEGAPEPDGKAILKRLYGAAIGNAGVYPSSEWTSCAEKDYRYLLDRLLPEREAEARDPDGWVQWLDRIEPGDFQDVVVAGEKDFGAHFTTPIYLGTPGPDREAEIRADERRKVLEGLTMGASYAEILARPSPTDEQDSPNRSDEP